MDVINIIDDRIPNPGSKKAHDVGCSCPAYDNDWGMGYNGSHDHFVIDQDCFLHGFAKDNDQ